MIPMPKAAIRASCNILFIFFYCLLSFLRHLVDTVAVEHVSAEATRPEHGLQEHRIVVWAFRIDHLVFLILHRGEVEVFWVDNVGPLRQPQVVESWIVFKGDVIQLYRAHRNILLSSKTCLGVVTFSVDLL